MEETLILATTVCSIVFFTIELSSYWVYGWFLKSDIVMEALDSHLHKGAHLNPYDSSIIEINDMPYISTCNSFLSSYHISDVGRVWVFSDAHKRISKLHNELLKKHIKNPSIKEQLNIK